MFNAPGFYPTPAPVVARMLEGLKINNKTKILEPSAGKGDICDYITHMIGGSYMQLMAEKFGADADILPALKDGGS